MPASGSEVSDDFEFIETPAAPTPVPPQEDYGVRTTTVSKQYYPDLEKLIASCKSFAEADHCQ